MADSIGQPFREPQFPDFPPDTMQFRSSISAVLATVSLSTTAFAQQPDRVANFFLDEATDTGFFIPDPNCPLDTPITSRLVLNQVRQYGAVPCAQHGKMTGNVDLAAPPCLLGATMRFRGNGLVGGIGSVEFDGYPEIDGLESDFAASLWIDDNTVPKFPEERLLLSGSDGNNSGWAITLRRDDQSNSRVISIGRPFDVCSASASFQITLPGLLACPNSNDAMDHILVNVEDPTGGAQSTVRVYVNGVLHPTIGTLPVLAGPPGPSSVWQIGGDPLLHTDGCVLDFAGRITDVSLFPRSLTPSEVLDVYGTPGYIPVPPTSIGSSYCFGIPNSTSAVGTLQAFGSVLVADNDVTFQMGSLPPQVFGMMLSATNESIDNQQVDLGGVLCIGGLIGRYNDLSELFQVDSAGNASMALDLTPGIRVPGGYSTAVAGNTWYFQAWHREVPGYPNGNSNLTLPVSITFQ